MVTALYRRYRPESFAELIGQSHVTEPLRTALRTDRVNHAYLFSGPRGCGKTTSARILARCLNCAEGPTDTPCGVCPSCVELGRGGSGSLDVVEIDAASHNGVDDARDLRERAVFAPARDRFKIFILDEAHMVTSQGFNALLKIVEEPPEHVKFIFATTEPEKVIGTIRSRTHHYPFRLVAPAQMLAYVGELCESEGVSVEPGVLPLVVKAGGGSVRDTLSLLDQLIAGSEGSTVAYERATALLGFTSSSLIDEVVTAVAERDAAGAFAAVDRIVQTGQDPRRFVEDLLERLRDLIIVAATGEGAAGVLRGTPADQIAALIVQAQRFGTAELSRAADTVSDALDEMVGATSPRLHLELMIARMLVPAAAAGDGGAIARLERLERRVGVETAEAPTQRGASPAPRQGGSIRPPEPAAAPTVTPPSLDPAAQSTAVAPPSDQPPAVAPPAPAAGSTAVAPPSAAPPTPAAASTAPEDEQPTDAASVQRDPGAVTLQHVRDAWPEILETVQRTRRSAWAVVYTSHPRALDDDVLTLSFVSRSDVESFRQAAPTGGGTSEVLRSAILSVLGIRVKFLPKVDGGQAAPEPAPAFSGTPAVAPAETPRAPVVTAPPEQRYGEAVVREILGASFLEETTVTPSEVS
ncbi:DNA polymerase III subunit gamma and tau [Amnibacterium sp.]|uniref:DNA polymerase III subunit gamma and tau n=1 Tax=Amnibacterium sp. TaxID=1872496 RepID=UPI002A1E60B0|nr:polymerase subunit gamma and tau [Amnibacterium sp.]